jgi:hypothetical protein
MVIAAAAASVPARPKVDTSLRHSIADAIDPSLSRLGLRLVSIPRYLTMLFVGMCLVVVVVEEDDDGVPPP